MKRRNKLISTLAIVGMALQMLSIRVEATTVEPPLQYGAIPNESQLKYHEEELAAFIHFGMNTYTNSEWGNGTEDPNNFNPTNLNCEEWVKTLKEAGFKRVILVGKHHDGFCLWKSDVTDHDVDSSTDWQKTKDGKGDVLEELSKACTKYNMDMGIYLSPWDAHEESYGYGTGTDDASDSNGDYNEFYMNQLKEILGNDKYGNNGKFVEVWMDGAKGSGAAAQEYKFEEWFALIEELEPGCVVFSPYATGVRWIGNESGIAGDPVWSKINKERIRTRYDNGQGDDMAYLNSGDAEGDIWSVGECDVSLTSGWFWHDGNSPKSMDQLSTIYFSSVGRGQPLLLNIAPDKTGRFTEADVERVNEFATAIKESFDENLAKGATATASSTRGNDSMYNAQNVLDDNKDTYWTMNDNETTGSIEIDLGENKKFDIVSIEEYIKLGQRISEFSVDVYSNGEWVEFGSGKTIGAKRLVRGAEVQASKIRINIESSYSTPIIENVEIYKAHEAFELEKIAPSETKFIDNVDFDNKDAWVQEAKGINNTGMYTNDANVETSFTFTGTKAWIVGTVDPNHGIMDVYVDEKKVGTIDTYKAERAMSQIIYTTEDLEYGEHTVKIVATGNKNEAANGAAIGIDGAYYLNNNGTGMFEIEESSYTVVEGESKEITIKRVAGTKGSADVTFTTSPGSAVHGRHYNDVTKTITFEEGQTEAKVTVETIDNNEENGTINFIANITNPTNGAILGFNDQAEISITDNDDKATTVVGFTRENPIAISDAEVYVEAEDLELDGIGGIIENKDGANNGKVVGWLGKTQRGNASLNMWVNSDVKATYDLEIRYLSGAEDALYYENQNKSLSGVVTTKVTYPDYDIVNVQVTLDKGLDMIKFFNNDETTANIDSIKITRVK